MATDATQPPSGGSSAATTYPPWVLLDGTADVEAGGSWSTADARTLVSTRTSSGHLIGVSLRLTAPPAVSSVCVHSPPGVKETIGTVLAAHSNSLLIYVSISEEYYDDTDDYFVYNTGAASAEPPRPPSLSLLPPHFLTISERQGPVRHLLYKECTGLLRRAEDGELAVAQLKIVENNRPEVVLLRYGQWSIKRPEVVIHGDDSDDMEVLLSWWRTRTVLPVGDNQLCWVNLYSGLLFCDVFDESPVLRYVAVPWTATDHVAGTRWSSDRGVCVTASGTVKLVGVFPRCCCGGAGSTSCKRSLHAYTINTWTLRMDGSDGMVWEMDGMVDATELWALDAYEGLPHVPLLHPIMSLDVPHIICFVLFEPSYYGRHGGYETAWLIVVDTRRKALLSVSRQSAAEWLYTCEELIPSRVSCYFDCNPRISSSSAPSSREGHVDMIPSSPTVIESELQRNDTLNSAWYFCKLLDELYGMTEESAVLAAFLEIPHYGLDRDDLMKAYRILSEDNGHWFKSLLGLPKNLRKDWLLMKIKATEG